MSKNVQYLDTEQDKIEWDKYRELARDYLKSGDAGIDAKIARLRRFAVDPVKPLNIGWYSVKAADGKDNNGGTKYKIIRKPEYIGKKKYFKSEPVCQQVVAIVTLEELVADLELWKLVVQRTERTLNAAESCVLRVWREPQSPDANKEDICYKLYGRTWAYSTMERVFTIVSNRCAAYAEMAGVKINF